MNETKSINGRNKTFNSSFQGAIIFKGKKLLNTS